MSITDRAKGVARVAAGISIATVGLSSCDNGGGVLEASPPPLVCIEVDKGQTLVVSGELVESDLVRVLINIHDPAASWGEIEVTEVVGAQILEFSTPSTQRIIMILEPEDGVTSGSFVLQGTMVDSRSTTCAFSRRFLFMVTDGGATVI